MRHHGASNREGQGKKMKPQSQGWVGKPSGRIVGCLGKLSLENYWESGRALREPWNPRLPCKACWVDFGCIGQPYDRIGPGEPLGALDGFGNACGKSFAEASSKPWGSLGRALGRPHGPSGNLLETSWAAFGVMLQSHS